MNEQKPPVGAPSLISTGHQEFDSPLLDGVRPGMPRKKRVNREYTKEYLEEMVKVSQSMGDLLKNIGVTYPSGSIRPHLRDKIKQFGIDTSHFILRPATSGMKYVRRTAEDILVLSDINRRQATKDLRRCMLESEIQHCCAVCFNPGEWRGTPIILQVDHINGNWKDNRLENLRFLCPNCHAQTPSSGRQAATITLVCVACRKEFGRRVKLEDKLSKVRKNGPHCSECKTGNPIGQVANLTVPVKGDWPSDEVLAKLVWEKPALTLAKEIGVTSSAIKRWCNRREIPTPPRGYWAKMKRDVL